MNILEKNIKYLCIPLSGKIKDALEVIQKNSERICFVVDKKKTLVSSVSDGDIRRGLLSGIKLSDKITLVHNTQFEFLEEGYHLNHAYKKFIGKISIIPVINKKGIFVGVVKKHDLVPFLDIRSKKILVVGLGYVGLTLSLVLAESGFSVIGYDKNKNTLDKIKKKEPPFYEKGLERYLHENVGKNFTISTKPVISDVYILTVGTPLVKGSLNPDLSILKKSILDICKLLKKNDLIILRSTIPVGCTRKTVIPLIEKKTGLKFGKDLFLAFCPERTIEGQAIEELKKLPQIIGSVCKKSSELAKRIFGEYNHTVIEVSDLESAELAKLIDNSYRDTIFAYSNQLALLTEKLNLDLVEIIEKVNLGYKRNQIPKPSPGVGGPCLSKDPYILSHAFKEQKMDQNNLIYHSRKVNESMPKEIVKRINKILNLLKKNKNAKIFITGFAFKGYPETSDLRSSTTLFFLEELKKTKFKNIWCHDFKVSQKDLKKISIKTCTIKEGFKNADAVFIMNNHKKYEDLNIFNLVNSAKKPVLFFDSWQIFDPYEIKNIKNVHYASVGSG